MNHISPSFYSKVWYIYHVDFWVSIDVPPYLYYKYIFLTVFIASIWLICLNTRKSINVFNIVYNGVDLKLCSWWVAGEYDFWQIFRVFERWISDHSCFFDHFLLINYAYCTTEFIGILIGLNFLLMRTFKTYQKLDLEVL